MKHWLLTFCSTVVLVTNAACATGHGSTPAEGSALALNLARSDGRTIQLDAYAGKPLLLFFFATYDQGSQVALLRLTEFARQNPSVQIAGVLVQPDAATFLPLFKESADVPFELYDDPEQHLLQGTSALGKLGAVPAFVLLDAAGRIRNLHYGPLTVGEIKQLVAQ